MNSYEKYLENEEKYNKRIDIIGRNGNTGEHYTMDINGATVTTTFGLSPCTAHNHWSHGFSIGDIVDVSGENFRVVGMSDKMLSLEIHEDV